MSIQGGQIIEGGPVILDAIPRHVNPFGQTRRVDTDAIVAAVAASSPGDVIYIEPRTYTENVVITTPGLTLIGIGARGQPWINPAAGGGLQLGVGADDTVLVNLGIGGAAGADYAINFNGVSECRAYGCKFEGPTGTIVLVDGTAGAQVSNLMLEDCEYAWGGVGISFDASGFGFPTQIRVRKGLFHGLTAASIQDNDGAAGVRDLWVDDVDFANQEDGTKPTMHLDLGNAGNTGMFSRNRFALATNASADLGIAAGISWAGNLTEAGVSTARPS